MNNQQGVTAAQGGANEFRLLHTWLLDGKSGFSVDALHFSKSKGEWKDHEVLGVSTPTLIK